MEQLLYSITGAPFRLVTDMIVHTGHTQLWPSLLHFVKLFDTYVIKLTRKLLAQLPYPFSPSQITNNRTPCSVIIHNPCFKKSSEHRDCMKIIISSAKHIIPLKHKFWGRPGSRFGVRYITSSRLPMRVFFSCNWRKESPGGLPSDANAMASWWEKLKCWCSVDGWLDVKGDQMPSNRWNCTWLCAHQLHLNGSSRL